MSAAKPTPAPAPLDWDVIELVVFDMDGTLYDQRRLRGRMLVALLRDAIAKRSLATLLTLRAFRRCRETLADSPSDDFLTAQYAIPAAQLRCTPEAVRMVVTEWIEQRPLALLAACLRPGVPALFEAITRAGKRIAIFSDYPATDKLAALGLAADFVVAATDADVGRPKPDVAGLVKLLRLARVEPHQAVLIGDRVDRDWAAATRASMRALILSQDAPRHVESFASYADARFQPLLRSIA
jgi:FMN phosphatase YigB (HAD superfamily)